MYVFVSLPHIAPTYPYNTQVSANNPNYIIITLKFSRSEYHLLSLRWKNAKIKQMMVNRANFNRNKTTCSAFTKTSFFFIEIM